MNSKVVTLGLVIFGLLLAAVATREGDLAWMALPFMAYLGVGLLQAPSAREIRLQAWRLLDNALTDGGSTVEVTVTVHNRGDSISNLSLSDPLQPAMEVKEGGLTRRLALGAGEEAQLHYTFQAGRGSFGWKTVHAVASDPFGLVEARLDLPATAEIQIQPRMDKFKALPIRPRSTLHSPGSIPARLGGSGTDFWGVREYHPGDSLRWLDWRLTARHPRQFFTKEFEQEEIADIGLILDGRGRTELRVGGESLFEHSLAAVASLSEVFLHQGHRVSLLVLGQKLISVYPGYGKLQLNRILRCLAKASPGLDGSLDSLEHLPVRMFSSHALIVILSPLVPSDWPLFPRLRAYGYQVLLISPDPVDFARAIFAQDTASRQAVRAARLERRLELFKIVQLGIPVVDWQVSRPLYPLVRGVLAHTRGQRRPVQREI